MGFYTHANGKIFVEAYNEQEWELVEPHRAVNRKIIQCVKCGKPATLLDCCYPYHKENTWCEKHKFDN